jgi:hypothetical protein
MVAGAARPSGWQAGRAFFSHHSASGRSIVEEELRLPLLRLRARESLPSCVPTTGIAPTPPQVSAGPGGLGRWRGWVLVSRALPVWPER